jgi:hypothetical protein
MQQTINNWNSTNPRKYKNKEKMYISFHANH